MGSVTVTDLLAEREIAEQLLNYCRGVDRLDPGLLASVWHPSGTAEYGDSGLCEPVGDVVDALIRRHAAFAFHHHNLMDPLLRIEGDRAVSETSVVAVLRGEGTGEGRWRDEHHHLRFLDRWSRRDGRWAIDHRIVLPTIAWTQSPLSGITGTLARRDRGDPGYDHLGSLGGEGVLVTQAEGLAVLRAERDIRRQLATYSRGVDRFDPDIWKSAWHTDATMRYETGTIAGTAHDMAYVMTFGHYLWGAHQHQASRSAIRVSGDRAVSETLNLAILHGYNDTSGISFQDHYRGRYLDSWERRDGKWAVSHRFTPRGCMWQQGVKSEMGAFMRRDRSDPSYPFLATLQPGDQDDLALLAGEQAIRAQLQTCCRALDRLDAGLLRSVWWPGGTVADRARGAGDDADEWIAIVLAELAAMAASTHYVTNTVIDIDGDRAVSESYFESTQASRPDENGRDDGGRTNIRQARGRYLDRWSQREGRWALDHREILLDFSWEKGGLEAGPAPGARRDRTDPSYHLFSGEFVLDR